MGGRQSGSSQTGLGQVQISLPPPHSNPFTSLTTTSSPSGGVLTASLQRFGSVPIPGRALRDTRDEHVDLQRRELGASARLRKKNLSGINKQTDRLLERNTQRIPTAASQHNAYIIVTYEPFIYLNLPRLPSDCMLDHLVL